MHPLANVNQKEDNKGAWAVVCRDQLLEKKKKVEQGGEKCTENNLHSLVILLVFRAPGATPYM